LTRARSPARRAPRGSPHLLRRKIAHAYCPDLSRLHGLGHELHRARDRPPRGKVDLAQVDRAASQPGKARLEVCRKAPRSRDESGRELRSKEDLLPGSQLANPPLGFAFAVESSGVHESRPRPDARLECLTLVFTGSREPVGKPRRAPSWDGRRVAPRHGSDAEERCQKP